MPTRTKKRKTAGKATGTSRKVKSKPARKTTRRRPARAARPRSPVQQMLESEPLETPQLADAEAKDYDGLENH